MEVIQRREDEFKELKKINNEWNQRVGKFRQERQKFEDQAEEEKRLRDIMALKENEKKIREINELLVKEEIENSKYFINLENIDYEIEKALNSRSDYNFAMDTYGNRYYNFSPKSSEPSKALETENISQTKV